VDAKVGVNVARLAGVQKDLIGLIAVKRRALWGKLDEQG
jgi:hypothetical protein